MSPRAMRRARRRAFLVGGGAALACGTIPAVASGAVIEVSNTNNIGSGSLRNAVLLANQASHPGLDTITFQSGVSGTINMTTSVPASTEPLEIIGPGAGVITVNTSSGGRVFDTTAPLSVSGLTLKGDATKNADNERGGAIRITGSGSALDVEDCVFPGNVAGDSGGAIYAATGTGDVTIGNSTFTRNSAGGTGKGGAVFTTLTGNLSIADSVFDTNSAPVTGGGVNIQNAGVARIDRSTFTSNSANGGGGLFSYRSATSLTVSQSTFTGNAANGGGGIYDLGFGGHPTTITNSTIVGNTGLGDGNPSYGGGIGHAGYADMTLSSSIVAGNEADTAPDLRSGTLRTEQILLDHDVIGTTAGGARIEESQPGTNKLNAGDPLLGPLGDNGGTTPTMLPEPASPAIDAATANGLTTDQRGAARTFDQPAVANGAGSDGTDAGAVELGDVSVEGAKLKVKKKQKEKGRKIVVAIKASAAEAVHVSATGTVKLGKKKLGLGKAQADIAAGESAKLKLKPGSKKSARKILKTLKSGKKAKASLKVTFTDASGNADTESAKAKLSGK